MRQARLTDLTCDQRLVKAAEEIIKSGSCAVSKPVRSGFTTSAIYACNKKSLRLLVLAPTRRILVETVSKASDGNNIRIPGNSECQLLKPEIKKNPILAQLPLTLPDCNKCTAKGWCEVRGILRAKDFGVAGITYAKLEALMLSRSGTAKEILQKISRADVVLLDEAHLLALPAAISVRAFASLKIPEKYKSLNRVYCQWLEFCQSRVKQIQELMEKAEQGYSSLHLSKSIFNVNTLRWGQLRKAWGQLRKLAVNHDLTDDEVLQLRDIITILSSTALSISYVSEAEERDREDEGTSGAVYISAGQARLYRALNEFLTRYVSSAKHLYVSGTLIEPQPGYFSELSGKEVRNVIFADLRGATEKLTLIPDRWKLTSWNFKQKIPLIAETIKAIVAREKQPIYLLAPNGRKASSIREQLKIAGIKDVLCDYYRSDKTVGVERKERICIAVGMAEIPANACDALAHGKDSEERWLDSRRLRRQAVDAATWQAVNRVRDPEGIVGSKIYFVGCRGDQVRQVARWGTDRQVVLQEIRETKSIDGKTIRTPIFEVQIDQELQTPRIFGEDKDTTHSHRRTVIDMIEKIKYYKNYLINSENRAISSIYINRENGAKLTFYNIPKNNDEINKTSSLLCSMFANRVDCYALQYKNSRSGLWEFCKVLSPLTDEIIQKHVAGMITIGTYEIGLDDQVTWCCDDIDSHNGEQDAREKVCRVVEVLRNYSIPFLLEASGSIESYHIWVLLAKTKTYNAYRFIRQINSEAKVDCECWPKQKSIQSQKGKYGNLVKLPICYHQKSGGRSAFLDADTFEPLEGPISLPGLVHLLEIPDLSESKVEGMPKVCLSQCSKVSTSAKAKTLDFCMVRALEDRIPLEGSEGHHLRLAVAVKAQDIGMGAEATAQLYRFQKDYDHDFSLNKVKETWSYHYSPWSCKTLRDKCGSIVKRYCPSCPFEPDHHLISEVEVLT